MLRHRSIRNEALSRGGASCAEARPNPLAAQQHAAADPAGLRKVRCSFACQNAREWVKRSLSRRAAEIEAIGPAARCHQQPLLLLCQRRRYPTNSKCGLTLERNIISPMPK